MAVRLHPVADLLVDYAAGGLSPALCISVSTHLHFCASCRSKAEQFADIGGNLLEDSAPIEMSCNLEDFFHRMEMMDRAEGDVKPLPAKVARQLEGEENDIPDLVKRLLPVDGPDWRFLSPSLRVARIAVGEDRFELALHKIKRGGKTPDHDHNGMEVTVVLQGSFSDETGVYHAGDFIVREPGDVHRPTASQHEACICLSVLEAPIRLVGPMNRLLNPFFSINPQ